MDMARLSWAMVGSAGRKRRWKGNQVQQPGGQRAGNQNARTIEERACGGRAAQPLKEFKVEGSICQSHPATGRD